MFKFPLKINCKREYMSCVVNFGHNFSNFSYSMSKLTNKILSLNKESID